MKSYFNSLCKMKLDHFPMVEVSNTCPPLRIVFFAWKAIEAKF